MKNSDKIRAQFEERYPVPSGMRWEPEVGPAGDYILDCSGCCSGERAARYVARWEAWQASRETLRITNPFPVQMGDTDGDWAREVAEKSLRTQGLKVVD
ncbi:hypothetical protein [Pseudomonas auratipiscis]|uniref:Phage protein n=1 Tax=Pseudomonas auratipiscis TaxID=3115853 RepID=A0AB35WQR6_9PSED|nr:MULTISPECIES: hypothetical protein [unclassified Pseudomonas]MEE1866918.1 hypothetical protein [Pseudomonas sp. 120P]MEE1960616.1 hypothetical protein [Pseudomonas sp. 119P]